VKEDYSLLNDFNIRERWSVFGEDVAQYVVSRMSSRIDEQAAQCTVICFFTLNFKGAGKSLFNSFRKINYWKALSKLIWRHKMVLVLSLLSRFQWVIQSFINLFNGWLPSNSSGLSVVKKIQKYYDTGGVPTELIAFKINNKESKNQRSR